MDIDVLIFLTLFFGAGLVIVAYQDSHRAPYPGLNFLGKAAYTLACGGAFASMFGLFIGWARPEGGGTLMLLSAAGVVVCIAAAFKLHDASDRRR